MNNKKSSGKNKGKIKASFSRLFDSAMIETRMIDSIVQSDGWSLAEFAHAPEWLRQIYNRHAIAACQEMINIEKMEGNTKPSEQ